MTEQEKFITAAVAVTGADLRLLNNRSRKYTGDGNAFANAEAAAEVAGISPVQGLMNRFGDKLGRIQEYLRQVQADGDFVDRHADEKFEDSIADARNYLLMILLYIKTDGGNDFSAFPSVVQQSILDEIPDLPHEGEDIAKEEKPGWFQRFMRNTIKPEDVI